MAKVVLGLPEFKQINRRPFTHTLIPNLRKLGLISPHNEERWRDVGMRVDSAPGVKGMPTGA